MKFKIDKWYYSNEISYYHVGIENDFLDLDIAKYLDLTLEEYQKILISHDAVIIQNFNNHYFRKLKDAKKVIKKLTPILVIANLTN